MPRILLHESSESKRIRMPSHVAMVLNQQQIATCFADEPGVWNVTNVRKVGVIRIGDYQVDLQPKLPITRLFFMMTYARDQKFWRYGEIDLDRESDLLTTIGRAFTDQVGRAISRGVLQGYRSVSESAAVIRGRLDIAAQITRDAGLPLPVRVTYDDYTVDIAENQLLLAAADRLLRMPSLPAPTRHAVRRIRDALREVSLIRTGAPLPEVRFTRINERYRNAIGLAVLILNNASLEHREGAVTATSFLFDMWTIYEDFVSSTLSAALSRFGGEVESQLNDHLDAGEKVSIRPDIVWQRHGMTVAAIDAKYKAEKNGRYPNADLYQVLAYCIRYGLSEGHLVYAAGNESPAEHVITEAKVTLFCHAIDLNAAPEKLLDNIRRLAVTIAAGADQAALHAGNVSRV